MDEHGVGAAELKAWEGALQEQREAEYDLIVASKLGDRERVRQVWNQVCVLRTRADLLLAEAIRVQCEARYPGPDPLTDSGIGELKSRGTEVPPPPDTTDIPAGSSNDAR